MAIFAGRDRSHSTPLRLLEEWIEEARERGSGAARLGRLRHRRRRRSARRRGRSTSSGSRTMRCSSPAPSGPARRARSRRTRTSPCSSTGPRWAARSTSWAGPSSPSAPSPRSSSPSATSSTSCRRSSRGRASRSRTSAPIRDRLDHLAQVQETAPVCPPDWGALRVRPESVELWSEADDRVHERRLFAREGDGWALPRPARARQRRLALDQVGGALGERDHRRVGVAARDASASPSSRRRGAPPGPRPAGRRRRPSRSRRCPPGGRSGRWCAATWARDRLVGVAAGP